MIATKAPPKPPQNPGEPKPTPKNPKAEWPFTKKRE